MTGIEYILHEAQEPHLFVMRKQKRDGPEKVTVLAAYYILDGSIYQAPQLYSVVSSRAVSIPNCFIGSTSFMPDVAMLSSSII